VTLAYQERSRAEADERFARAPLQAEPDREREHEEREALLDEQQRQHAQQRAPPLLAVGEEGGRGDQQRRERHLVDVEDDRRLDPAEQPVGDAEQQRAAAAQPRPGEEHDRHHRRGDQQRLRDDQRSGPALARAQRRERDEDRREVVAKQRRQPLEAARRRLEAAELPDGLVEDPQIKAGGAVRQVAQQAGRRVEQRQHRDLRRQQPAETALGERGRLLVHAAVGRSRCGNHARTVAPRSATHALAVAADAVARVGEDDVPPGSTDDAVGRIVDHVDAIVARAGVDAVGADVAEDRVVCRLRRRCGRCRGRR